MDNSYFLFKKNIDVVLSSLDYTNNKIKLFDDIESEQAHEKSINHLKWKFEESGTVEYSKFIYNGSIVSIYGALERLIEDLIEGYISTVNSIVTNYDDLDSAIKKNHIEFSFNFAAKVTKDRNLESIKKLKKQKEIIHNLQSCFNDEGYVLNKKAFSIHTANFRFDIIRESFSNVGIRDILKEVLKNDTLIRHRLAQNLGIKGSAQDDNSAIESELKNILDDLAQRRNEIAHGARPESYLSYELLFEKASTILDFGQSLCEYCKDYAEKTTIRIMDFEDSESKFINLDRPLEIFNDYNAIGFKFGNIENIKGRTIKLGDSVYLVNEHSPNKIIKSSIISIVANKNSLNDITLSEQLELSIGLSTKPTQSFLKRKVYILQ